MIDIKSHIQSLLYRIVKMKKILGIILIVCIITSVGCQSNSQTESDEKNIRELTQGWIDVAEKGDTEGYFDFITDDFFYHGTGGLRIDNLDSLRAFLEPFFENNTFSVPEWETQEILISGNIAIHIWSGIAYVESNDGISNTKLDRKYLDVYRKDQNGEWKCYIHSYSNNN